MKSFAEYCGFTQISNGLYERKAVIGLDPSEQSPVMYRFAEKPVEDGYVLAVSYGNFKPVLFAFPSMEKLLLASANRMFVNCTIWELLDNIHEDHTEAVIDNQISFPEEVNEISSDNLDLTTCQLCDLIIPTFGAKRIH